MSKNSLPTDSTEAKTLIEALAWLGAICIPSMPEPFASDIKQVDTTRRGYTERPTVRCSETISFSGFINLLTSDNQWTGPGFAEIGAAADNHALVGRIFFIGHRPETKPGIGIDQHRGDRLVTTVIATVSFRDINGVIRIRPLPVSSRIILVH